MQNLLVSWNTFQVIVYSWMAIGVITFFYLLKVTAPYGRHTSRKWGPVISNHIGWILMEAPVMLVLLFIVAPVYEKISSPAFCMIGLFLFHYVNRTFVFPFRLKTKGKTMPVLIVIAAVCFNLMNGFSLGYYFARFESYSNTYFSHPAFIIGLMLFVTGMFINWKSDAMLLVLRKEGETHYLIPRGWLFNYISCPNLFGELLEWLGFAILCQNLPAVSFFIWTAANLVPRALSHHKWYKEKFTDYPSNRKALLPGIL